jgi:hypothetical protein
MTILERNIKVSTMDKFKELPKYKEWEALNKIVRDAVNQGDIAPITKHIDRECALYQELIQMVKNQPIKKY